jgi:hypothetical protein
MKSPIAIAFLLLVGVCSICHAQGVQYTYRNPALYTSDPGTGGVSFYSGSLSHVGDLRISLTDLAGESMANDIANWKQGYVTANGGLLGILSYKLAGNVTNEGSWADVGWLYFQGNATFHDGDVLRVYATGLGVTPEPASWLLLLVGAIGGGIFYGWSKSRKAVGTL